jgi:hypothetical protein
MAAGKNSGILLEAPILHHCINRISLCIYGVAFLCHYALVYERDESIQ